MQQYPGLVVGKVIRVVKGRFTVAFDPDQWELRGMNEKKLREFCKEQGIECDLSEDLIQDSRGLVAVRSEQDLWFVFLFKMRTEKPARERDFGVNWTHPRYPGLRFRVSWNERTGELYAVSFPKKVRLSLGYFQNEEEVESILRDWPEKMWKRGSLEELEEVLR